MTLAFPPQLARVLSRLPVAPPSIVFCAAANRLLWPALDRDARQALVGRHYAISVRDVGVSVRFTVRAGGFVAAHAAPDLAISATAADFLLLLRRREDPDTLFFSRRLVSEGDTELGLTVKNLLDAIEPEAVLRQAPRPLARLLQSLLIDAPRPGTSGLSS